MTIQQCIALVDAYEPNAYAPELKAMWLSEVEGKVWTELFLMQPQEYTPLYENIANPIPLALPAPHDKIYTRYLQAMIHYANGEYDRYAASMQMFNQAWHELCVWFGQDYDTSDMHRNKRVEGEVILFEENAEPVIKSGTKSGSGESWTYALLNIPPRCAFVGGQIIFRSHYLLGASISLSILTEDGLGFGAPDIWEGSIVPGGKYAVPMIAAPQGGLTLMAIISTQAVSGGTVRGQEVTAEFPDVDTPKLLYTGRMLVPSEEHLDWGKIQVHPVQQETLPLA